MVMVRMGAAVPSIKTTKAKNHSCGFSLAALRFWGCVAGISRDERGTGGVATAELDDATVPATNDTVLSALLVLAVGCNQQHTLPRWNILQSRESAVFLWEYQLTYNTDAGQSNMVFSKTCPRPPSHLSHSHPLLD